MWLSTVFLILQLICWWPGTSSNKPYVPRYMLDLYEGKAGPMIYDLVRSYSNIYGDIYDQSVDRNSHIYIMEFNMTVEHPHEKIELAELRIYTKIHTDSTDKLGIENQVTIYNIDPNEGRKIIITRSLKLTANSWEMFNVTEAVLDWIKSPGEHRLEVRIEKEARGDLDVSVVPYQDTEPLLIIYSTDENKKTDDNRNRLRRSTEVHRIEKRNEEEDEEQEEMTNYIVEEPGKFNSKKGKVRRRKNPCRRKPMKVKFAEIGYNWIIAPDSYEAFECTGKCFFPISEHLTPTTHSVLQTLMHEVHPKAIARACCVPTKLAPISIMYQGDDGGVNYKYDYGEMVVTECGCR